MNITHITSAALVVLSLSACAELQNNPKRSLGIRSEPQVSEEKHRENTELIRQMFEEYRGFRHGQ